MYVCTLRESTPDEIWIYNSEDKVRSSLIGLGRGSLLFNYGGSRWLFLHHDLIMKATAPLPLQFWKDFP